MSTLFRGFGLPLLISCLGVLNAAAQSNEGTDFWMAFMEHRDIGSNSMVVMITSKQDASGQVSIPLLGWRETFSVAANDVKIITLPSTAETLGSETVTQTGIHVTASPAVSVYIHQYSEHRSEAATILPAESIGDRYYVMSFTGHSTNNEEYPSEFIIVAGKHNTQLQITPATATVGGRPAGQPFSVLLNAGETYQIQARSGFQDLTGSLVTANQPFSLLAGARWTGVPYGCGTRDNLLEMMYPIDTWGRRFISMPNAAVRFDVFRVLAAEDNTHVTVSGATEREFVLDAGQFLEYEQTAASYITADRPILVAQYNVGSQCNGHIVGDPSMLLLNSIEQTRDTVTLYNSNFEQITENYINIVGFREDFDFITFDGQPLSVLAPQPGFVGPDNGYFYATVKVQQGAHTIISGGCGVIASAYGYGILESYAYGGGASFKRLNVNPIVEGGCLETPVKLSAGLSASRFDLEWRLHDGTVSSEHEFEHQYTSSGNFLVQLIAHDRCLATTDTLRRMIGISPRQTITVNPDLTSCAGERVQFQASALTGSVRYEWSGPEGFSSSSMSPSLTDVQPSQSGVYSVVANSTGCRTLPATTRLTVHPLPNPELGADATICVFHREEMSITPGDFAAYRWQDGRSPADYVLNEPGLYRVTVTDDNGCSAADSLLVSSFCPTRYYVPNAFSPNGDGANDEFRVYVFDATDYRLQIFDRWGEMLFETTDLEAGWSGQFNDRPLPPGLYLWQLDLAGRREDGSDFLETKAGEVYLIR